MKHQILTLIIVFGSLCAVAQTTCTDETACTYGEAGPCEYTSCAGCRNELACNYDGQSHITKDDGSCEFPDGPCAVCDWFVNGQSNPADGSGQLLSNDADGDGWCDDSASSTNSSIGQTGDDACSDPEACNFNYATNTGGNEACVAKVLYYHDEDGDGAGDYELGYLCNEPAQSTTFLLASGVDLCTDPLACNFIQKSSDSSVTVYPNEACSEDIDGDGLCDTLGSGNDLCTDNEAPNFDGNDPDGFGNEACCTDGNDNGVCDDRELWGCQDPNACNYFAEATLDDGTCKFTGTTTQYSSQSTSQYSVDAEDNPCDACIAANTAGDSTITISEALRIALGLSTTTFRIGRYVNNDKDSDGVCDNDEQVGCGDPTACNYKWNTGPDDLWPQAQEGDGDPHVDENGDAIYISEPCYYDEATDYGVTKDETPCAQYCKWPDVCDVCGGDGQDVDNDDLCDDADNCKDLYACNYDDPAATECKYYNDCGQCVAGVDVSPKDGQIDNDTSDQDGDGICDTIDGCWDTSKCNYNDPAATACLEYDACGLCGGSGVDVDNDGLCDDLDNCVDTSKCNWDYNLYPSNVACMVDENPANGVCDDFEIWGCKDSPSACNYNAEATAHLAGSCVFEDAANCELCSGDLHDGSDYIVVSDSDGDGVCDASDLCSDVGACNFDATQSHGNEPCGTDSDGNGVCDTPNYETLGCTNSAGCNYNSSATKDDGSCIYPIGCQICSGGQATNNDIDLDGVCDNIDECTDTSACNYVAATSGNADCVYAISTPGKNCQGECIDDIDNDGLCDFGSEDACFDLRACNFADSANEPCIFRDDCGRCGAASPGLPGYNPALYCDCEFNVLDSLGNCGGGCFSDSDGDGVCDDIDPCPDTDEELDECGVCGGDGAVFECGCFDKPAEACSCEPDGTVVYPAQGRDCDGECIYGDTLVNGETICLYFDKAELTVLPEPTTRSLDPSGKNIFRTNAALLEEWIIKFDTLHARMSKNLDDGSLTGASEKLTIEDHILDKGDLDVLGTTRLSGLVQMDSNVVILGNLTVEKNATIKGTTFSQGGIETTSMNMSGDLSVGGATVIDSTLEVLQSTLMHDSLTLFGPLTIGANNVFHVDASGNTQVNGQLRILDSLVATTNGTRLASLDANDVVVTTLQTTDSVLIKKNLQVRGDSKLKGSLDVDKNLVVQGTLGVSGASTLQGISTTSISNTGLLTTGSILNTSSLETGSLTVTGPTTTQSLSVTGTTTLHRSLRVLNSSDAKIFEIAPQSGGFANANLVGSLRMFASPADYASGTTSILMTKSGSLTASGLVEGAKLTTTDADAQNTILGALNVGKRATLKDGLIVKTSGTKSFEVKNDGSIHFYKASTVAGDMTLNGNLTLNSGSGLTVGGSTNLQNLTVSGTTNFGSIVASSGASFNGNLTSAGALKMGGGLYVGAAQGSIASDYVAVFDGSAGGLNRANGISIQLNHTGDVPDGNNHYMVFKNAQGNPVGEIRGETSGNWKDDKFKELEQSEYTTQVALSTTKFLIITRSAVAKTAEAVVKGIKALAHFIPDGWMVFWPNFDWADIPPAATRAFQATKDAELDISEAVTAGIELAENSVYLGMWNAANEGDWSGGGVSYASGNGDYAEWIEKENWKDDLTEQQIVGVTGGKVSLITEGADHLMVISTAPIVLGNQPAEADEDKYEKVAFMGQVPVQVVGQVRSGDFIIPSGDNDGYGIAIHPENINESEASRIVGVAWQDGNDRYFNSVNVAVGLNQSATAQRFVALKNQMTHLRMELDEVTAMVMGEPVHVPIEQPRVSFLKKVFRSGDGDHADSQSRNGGGDAPQSEGISILTGMSDEEILEAVESSKQGDVPQMWRDNMNGQDLSRIMEVVIEKHVSAAEEESRKEAERLQQEGLNSSIQRMEVMSYNVHSFEDLEKGLIESLEGVGISAEEIMEINNQITANVLTHEFSTASLLPRIRESLKFMPRTGPFGHVKPGTLAEKKLTMEIQGRMFDAIAQEFPDIHKHMSLPTNQSQASNNIPTLGQ